MPIPAMTIRSLAAGRPSRPKAVERTIDGTATAAAAVPRNSLRVEPVDFRFIAGLLIELLLTDRDSKKRSRPNSGREGAIIA